MPAWDLVKQLRKTVHAATLASLESVLWAFAKRQGVCSLERGCDEAAVGGISGWRGNGTAHPKSVEFEETGAEECQRTTW